MNSALIGTIVSGLVSALPDDIVKKGIDDLLDVVEDAVAKTSTKIDDMTVLPLIQVLRHQLDIPDDIGGDPD